MMNKRQKEYLNIVKKLKLIEFQLNKLEVQIFNNTSQISQLSKQIKEEVISISKNIEELKDPFLLFIVGPGKYGKTTLINSLIQKNLLEISDIPNTWKLDVLIKSDKEKIDILLKDDDKLSLDFNEGILFLKEEELKYNESKSKIKKELDIYKNSAKRNINDLKEYREMLKQNYLYNSNVEEVRYYIKKSGILDEFIIVDTPGINQTLKGDTRKRMFEYYQRADGVIWILDAQNVVAKCSKEITKELKENYILDENLSNIICVVNKMDTIRQSDKEKIKIKIKEIYNNEFKDIVFISSKYALNGYENKDIESLNSSNIQSLKESIDKNFKSNSENIQIEAKYNLIKVSKYKLNKYINKYKRQLYNDINKYEEAKLSLNENIIKLEKKINKNIEKYLSINNLAKNDIESEVILLEEYINLEIKKMYESMLKTSFIEKESYILIKGTKEVSISKLSDLIELHKLIQKLQNESIQKNSIYIKYKKNVDIEWKLRFELEKFKKKILEIISDKLVDIKLTIDNNRESSFRIKYTDYFLIQENIEVINNISKEINTWE